MRVQQILSIVETIRPILAGQPPEIQGAVLAELMAIWLAGHPSQVRSEMLELQIGVIRQLSELNDQICFRGN